MSESVSQSWSFLHSCRVQYGTVQYNTTIGVSQSLLLASDATYSLTATAIAATAATAAVVVVAIAIAYLPILAAIFSTCRPASACFLIFGTNNSKLS